jgi:hypothetical protein
MFPAVVAVIFVAVILPFTAKVTPLNVSLSPSENIFVEPDAK